MSPHVFPKSILEQSFQCVATQPIASSGFNRIITDSRTVQPGDLFVALPGDLYDGHSFIDSAFEKGAAAALVSKAKISAEQLKKYPLYVVADPLTSFRNLAATWRKQFKIPVVGIGGCVGKTTTKEMLAAILTGRFQNVLKTEFSQNGFIGIPMTLLRLGSQHDVAVIEIGIDDIGAMEKHLELVRPTHGVVTAIGPEHLELLKNVETVFEEEMKLANWIQAHSGKVSLNLDDSWIQGSKQNYPHSWTYSLKQSGARVIGKVVGNELQVTDTETSKTFSLPIPLKGEHNAQNLLAATALALSLGLTEVEVAQGLKSFRTAKGRSEWKKFRELRIFSDYYNASPVSIRASFNVIKTESKGKPVLLCLGDMLELGADEEKYHRELAPEILALKPAQVLLFGPRMKWLEDELKDRVSVKHYASHEDIVRDLISFTQSPAILLLKGSRGMMMENVLKHLESHGEVSTES